MTYDIDLPRLENVSFSDDNRSSVMITVHLDANLSKVFGSQLKTVIPATIRGF